METDTLTNSLEDAQRISSGTRVLDGQSESPEPKRRCTEGNVSTSPLLFSSPSEIDESSDGALFPSDNATASSASSCARYPSEEDERGPQTDHSEHERSDARQDGSNASTAVAMPLPIAYDSDEDREQVATLLVSKCCQRQCLLHLTAHDVLTARQKYCSLSRIEQRQWLMDRVHEHSNEEEKGKLMVKFSVAGREICKISWCQIYRISHRRLSRIVQSVSHGWIVAEHGNKGKQRSNTKSESAIAWMTKYFNLVGDKMPHNSQIHLPSWETQKDVHLRYTEDMTLQSMPASDIVSLSMFYKIWANHFSNVVIPEVRPRIICMTLNPGVYM